ALQAEAVEVDVVAHGQGEVEFHRQRRTLFGIHRVEYHHVFRGRDAVAEPLEVHARAGQVHAAADLQRTPRGVAHLDVRAGDRAQVAGVRQQHVVAAHAQLQ